MSDTPFSKKEILGVDVLMKTATGNFGLQFCNQQNSSGV